MVARYERVRQISAGRFGSTTLVSCAGRPAVLKTIDASRLDSAALRDDVVEDVRMLARLRHPQLLNVVEVFREGGIICIVTSYAEAGDVTLHLDRARRAGRQLESALTLQWLTQAMVALSYLHQSGVVHRDLRSRRLLLTRAGRLLVSGLALSPLLARALGAGAPQVEAVRYLAPEVLAGTSSHTSASDMWAMGVILFELLALRAPYEHEHPRSLTERILSTPVPPLPSRCAAGSVDLRRVCTAMLSRDAEKRPSAAQTLSDTFVQATLRALVNDEPVPATEHWGASVQVPTPRTAPVAPCKAVPTNALRPLRAGPLMLGSPLSTPRALRRVGEVCVRTTGREQIGPSAALPPKRVELASSLRGSFARDVVDAMISEVLVDIASPPKSALSVSVRPSTGPEVGALEPIEVSHRLELLSGTALA
mmetsp:Transcript_92226/g.264331  ORF Transcript_92226/g.264331 Transcript_92226/m.264331 type:complete len:423 (-) Transcript_92226:79-1347(-)